MTKWSKLNFICGWCKLWDGTLRILSLGLYYSDVEMKFLVWNAEQEAAKWNKNRIHL